MCALFGTQRDVSLFRHLSRELMWDIISQQCAFYQLIADQTKVNIYGKRKEKIEIIGRKCFSIAPPSIHADGISTYEFINNFWPPPDFPNELKAIYFQQKKIKIINKEKTVSICSRCQGETCIHKKRLIKEVNYFKKKNMMWICKKCRVHLDRA